jgi:hypothetical protein
MSIAIIAHYSHSMINEFTLETDIELQFAMGSNPIVSLSITLSAN